MNRRKRIFIYEPHATGHHTIFLDFLLAEIARQGNWHATLLTSEDASKHPSFASLLTKFKNQLDVVLAQPIPTSKVLRDLVGDFYAEQYRNFKSLRREFAALQRTRAFDFALVPYMEAVGIHNLAVRLPFPGTPWGAIAFGLRFHFPASRIKAPSRQIDALQRFCFARLLKSRTLRGIFSLDPYLVSWASHQKVIYVPDPSRLPPPVDGSASRRSLGLPQNAPILLVYGAIDKRKCLDLLLPAVAAIDANINVTIVVAGIQDRRLQKTLLQGEAATYLRRESRLFEFDHFITPKEEHLLFAAADMVWTYYADSFGSSGVLVKAGQYARPAIANDAGLVGKIVSDERCGLVVSDANAATVARAIIELATQPAIAMEMGNRGFARFSRHTPEAFSGPICASIEAAKRGD